MNFVQRLELQLRLEGYRSGDCRSLKPGEIDRAVRTAFGSPKPNLPEIPRTVVEAAP